VHYYAQHQLEGLTPSHTVYQEVEAAAPDEPPERLRGILGAFLFSGDEVEKTVSVLSGGERARLALAKMLARPANFLCLDEPTNHLDVAAREVVEEALAQFGGTMVFISHDRYFINRLATRVVEVRAGGLRSFVGNYDDYLEAVRREAEAAVTTGRTVRDAPAAALPQRADGGTPGTRGVQARRRARAEAVQARSRALRPLRDRLAVVEAEIQGLEVRLQELAQAMGDPALYRDGARAREAAHEKKATEERLAWLLRDWEDLSHQLSNEQ
jgi:ATP-binding cassette subfamily F protein 3